jgi:hypothetical protein
MEKLQKELSELKLNQTLGKPIVQFLEGMSFMDDELANRINQADKSLKICIEYVFSEVKKKAAGANTAVMTDQEVYELAVKYYETDNMDLTIKPIKATVVAGSTKDNASDKVSAESQNADSEDEDGEEDS